MISPYVYLCEQLMPWLWRWLGFVAKLTCVSFATSPNHFHLHGICCSHTCTCGLITCVSHINTISPPRIVTQLPKPHKDLSISSFLVIDDNSTKIWKLSSFGFMLLSQAILPCVNNFGQVLQTRIGSISSPYICASVFGLKLAHMHELELWESNSYQMMLRCKEWTMEAWYQSECTFNTILSTMVS